MDLIQSWSSRPLSLNVCYLRVEAYIAVIHTRTGALLKERRTGENGAGSVQKVNTVDR